MDNEVKMNFENFSNEKIDYIKNFVDTQLDKMGVYSKIKIFVEENIDEVDEENLMSRLKEAGIVDEIIENFGSMGVEAKTFDKTRRMIYFKLVKGKGFIDYISFIEPNTFFYFDILFLGQRFRSKKISVTSEFNIDQIFLLDFNPLKLDINIDFETLKKLSAPIHLVMLTVCDEKKSVISTKNIEWRWTLSYGTWKLEANMFSPNNNNKLNIGVIDVDNIFLHLDSNEYSTIYREKQTTL